MATLTHGHAHHGCTALRLQEARARNNVADLARKKLWNLDGRIEAGTALYVALQVTLTLSLSLSLTLTLTKVNVVAVKPAGGGGGGGGETILGMPRNVVLGAALVRLLC